MRSLIVFHIGGVSGPQRSLGGALEWLLERGEVEFLVPDPGPTADEFGAYGRVTVAGYSTLHNARGPRALAAMTRRLLADVRLFRRELRERRPDVVVSVTTVLPALLVAARLERVPAVVYAGEIYAQGWKGATPLRARGVLLAGLTGALADGIVCCSAAVARQFHPLPRRPVAVAYPVIDPGYADGDRERGRTRLGIADGPPCVAVVGSLTRGRGQDVALRALPLLRRHFPSLHLAVVGSPHDRPADHAYARELRALAQALGVEDAVVFADATRTGYGVSAMADVYAAADLVVNPARFAEPFGRVAPEALVARRPVVASRVGGIPEVISDREHGLLVGPDDPIALAAAVRSLLEDEAGATAMVEAGRRRVFERFGPQQEREAWARVLGAALSRRGELSRAGDHRRPAVRS